MQLDHGTRRFAELEAEQRQRSVDQAVRVEFKFRHQTACSKGPAMSSSRRWRPKRPSYPKSPRVGNPQPTSRELIRASREFNLRSREQPGNLAKIDPRASWYPISHNSSTWGIIK